MSYVETLHTLQKVKVNKILISLYLFPHTLMFKSLGLVHLSICLFIYSFFLMKSLVITKAAFIFITNTVNYSK